MKPDRLPEAPFRSLFLALISAIYEIQSKKFTLPQVVILQFQLSCDPHGDNGVR
jgi:hypothetical protein